MQDLARVIVETGKAFDIETKRKTIYDAEGNVIKTNNFNLAMALALLEAAAKAK